MRRHQPRSGGWAWCRVVVTILLGLMAWTPADAARVSDVRKTKHNLSSNNYGLVERTVKATGETEVCVFCHTPHGAVQEAGVASPLWNRNLSTATYSTYESTSIDANVSELRAGPGGTSKLCLSCHDGALAVSAVNVLDGGMNVTIAMQGLDAGDKMPSGSGLDTGFTRNLGTDLTNDHPISFTFDATLATADGELRSPPFSAGGELVVGTRVPGVKPVLPLDGGMVQCASCHDPHLSDELETASIKFLRLNRFQNVNPIASNFDPNNDIICLACHDKGKSSWSPSVHANSTDANETYKSGTGSPGALREFPTSQPVWKAACLNCHDTHTVSGARRLLREGSDSTVTPKTGGKSAIEETCYQCHTTPALSILDSVGNKVPDIRTDFTTVGNKHMPITTADQATTGMDELHDISNADFEESQDLLGKNGNLSNRHVECTDCHNPHRILKNRQFTGLGSSSAATHEHSTTTQHSNIASGVLRGSWGVEPIYGSTTWMNRPTGYTVKKGDPGGSVDTSRNATHVTREYQVCLKCHSDYGYDDNGTYPAGNRPMLGSFSGGTSNGTNNMSRYTNQAVEFGAAANDTLTGTDQGEPGGNHRSWHPVMFATGRTLTARAMSNKWTAPWNGNNSFIGNQTMYCSDCHGNAIATSGSTSPVGGAAWGPHGSANNFVLKGVWNNTTGSGQQNTGLCFKCHDYTNYATRDGASSGFCCDNRGNLHAYHTDKIGKIRCNWCHTAVPHGWKNKALLVNLNDVGPEAGLAPGTQVRNKTTTQYNRDPYYMNAILKVVTWQKSGQWTANSCGSKGFPGVAIVGKSWMVSSTENCANPP